MARILIAGGSLGGLLAANVPLRDGHDVQVLEKTAASLDGRSASVVTHAALGRALRRAGVTVDATLGVRVESRVVLDPNGEVVARVAMPQVLTSWSWLYALRFAAFPAGRCQRGVAVAHVEPQAGGGRVHGEDGEVFQGDLLVASDGIRSAVRAQFAPLAVPQYAGYIAWRAVCDEALQSHRTLGSVFNCVAFGLPAGEQTTDSVAVSIALRQLAGRLVRRHGGTEMPIAGFTARVGAASTPDTPSMAVPMPNTISQTRAKSMPSMRTISGSREPARMGGWHGLAAGCGGRRPAGRRSLQHDLAVRARPWPSCRSSC